MTDDITTALETVRDYLNSKYLGHAEANRPHPNGCVWCALSEIETELTRLRKEVRTQHSWRVGAEAERDEAVAAFEAECKRAEDHYAWYVKAGAERDEAIAALREVESGEFDDVDPDDGLHARSVRQVARAALARLSPKEPTDE